MMKLLDSAILGNGGISYKEQKRKKKEKEIQITGVIELQLICAIDGIVRITEGCIICCN